MKMKFLTKITALTLALTMALSIVPMTAISTSAEINATSFDNWVTNQFYTRCLSYSGTILQTIGELSGNKAVAVFTSFINSAFCGGGGSNDQTVQLQNTCNEILDTTKKVQSITNDINSKIADRKITVSSHNCDTAWENQVMDYITKSDESPYDFYNVYVAYRDYLEYAANNAPEPDDDKLKYYENNFISELFCYYQGKTNTSFVSDEQIYTTDTIDVCLTGMISSILNTMNPKTSSIGVGNRFIDQAAMYAYYAYPFSSEQAEFIDQATERQINTVTYLMMIYQDFLAHRAEYFKSQGNTNNYSDVWDYCIDKHYTPLLTKYTTSIENFLNGDIYLKDINAHTTLDNYVRGDCTSLTYDSNKKSFELKNTNHKTSHRNKYIKCTTEYYYKSDITSYPTFTKDSMEFYKNASVTVKDGKLVFTPFYVINSNCLDECNKFLKYFDLNDEDVHGEIRLTAYYDTHYLNVDYYNLKGGKFTDGTNSYVPISNTDQLKNLINETYYTANKCTPYSYFAPFICHGRDNPMYLLLNGSPTISRPENTTHYTKFPVFNMSNEVEYCNNWSSETMDLYNLQSDRKASENKTNSMYTLILVPQNSVTKSEITTELYGEGEITVNGEASTVAVAGQKAEINISAPENYSITEVYATYNGVQKTIHSGISSNEMTIDFPVPYADVIITAVTANVPHPLDTDDEGNYLIGNYSDLQRMAEMVNSGYDKYANGNYVVTNDFTACDNGFLWTTPIGTSESPFTGKFDGQGYTISNFWFDENSQEEYFGLFGIVDGGKIENINIDMPQGCASARHYSLGTICSYIINGSIENCTATGLFNVEAEYAGGIVGVAENSTIEECKTKLNITSGKYCCTGDICGYNTNSQIIDCESDNTIFTFPF